MKRGKRLWIGIIPKLRNLSCKDLEFVNFCLLFRGGNVVLLSYIIYLAIDFLLANLRKASMNDHSVISGTISRRIARLLIYINKHLYTFRSSPLSPLKLGAPLISTPYTVNNS